MIIFMVNFSLTSVMGVGAGGGGLVLVYPRVCTTVLCRFRENGSIAQQLQNFRGPPQLKCPHNLTYLVDT